MQVSELQELTMVLQLLSGNLMLQVSALPVQTKELLQLSGILTMQVSALPGLPLPSLPVKQFLFP